MRTQSTHKLKVAPTDVLVKHLHYYLSHLWNQPLGVGCELLRNFVFQFISYWAGGRVVRPETYWSSRKILKRTTLHLILYSMNFVLSFDRPPNYINLFTSKIEINTTYVRFSKRYGFFQSKTFFGRHDVLKTHKKANKYYHFVINLFNNENILHSKLLFLYDMHEMSSQNESKV